MEAQKGQALPPIGQQIKPNLIYKIDVDQKTYRIKAIKWEKDSLVAQIKRRKDVKKSFNATQITNVRERRFSETRSNFFTVLSYTAIGTGIFFLVK